MEHTFTMIYENKTWGDNKNTQYNGSSGGGSDIEYNINTYIPFLKKYIDDNNIKTVVDLGCGDFRCGSLIYNDLDVVYTGYDTYKKIIEHNSYTFDKEKYHFKHLDFFNNKEIIVGSDLCIIKDVLQHWNTLDIYTFLDYLVDSHKFKYILICNCANQLYNQQDISNGQWRPLRASMEPLSKYNPIVLYEYNSKEVSVIKC